MCFSVSASAETIVLKSGQTVEGKILEKTDKYIKMDCKGETLYYFFSEVKSIDGKPVNISKESVVPDISNAESAKSSNRVDNVDITAESTVEDMLMKADYCYSIKDFDKAIKLCEAALKKTDDKNLITKINLSLSSNYLEKGREAYKINKDDSFYKLSIQSAKKYLEADPYSCLALSNIGFAYFEMQDWKQAVFYFTEVENYVDKSDPSNAAIETARSTAEENMRAQ